MRTTPTVLKTFTLFLAMGFFARLFGASAPEERKGEIERLASVPASQEALDRRERSKRQLKTRRVPINGHLPLIEDSTTATLRTPRVIAERLLGCTIVAVVGETGDPEAAKAMIRKFAATSFLTAAEREFLANKIDDKQARVQFSWQYERIWVLLWALGYVPELKYPDASCDMPQLVSLVKDASLESLLAHAKPRSFAEVLDEADLIYRLHWAVRDAQLKKAPAPGGLDSGVVMERHATLNWLIGYLDQDWDDITTDT
jgi:hypothetical protein